MYDFGLSDEQFFRLTPAKFSALSDRHDHATKQHDLRFGQVCSVLAAVNGAKKKNGDEFTANDFVPKYGDEDEEAPKLARGEMTPDQIFQHMLAAFPKSPKKKEEAAAPAEAHGG